MENACGALLLKPGRRKTSITLGAIKLLKQEGQVSKVLVIAPVRACYSVWPKEVKKWRDFAHLTVEILHGPRKDDALEREADLYLVNPEGLAWLLGETKKKVMRKSGRKVPYDQALVGQPNVAVKTEVTYDLTRFLAAGFDMLVVDEASKFRKPSTERFNALKQVLGTFRRRVALTGSPAPKWLLDLFGIMYLVDQGSSLGAYITHFRKAYFMPTGYGGYDWQPQLGAEEAIYEAIAPLVFAVGDDGLQLPALVEEPIYIDLPPAARKLYDQVEKEFFAELDSGEAIVAANAGVATTKCRQIASGGLWLQQEVDEDGRKVGRREWKKIHDAKTEAVSDHVEELMGRPCLVGYDFGHDLERLQAEFPKAPHIGGGVSPKKSDVIIDAWNRDEIEVLLGQPAAMGHALNAQEGSANEIVVYSPNPNFEDYDQFIRRILRSGNKNSHVFVRPVVARDTIDEATWALLKSKDCTQRAFMTAMEEYSLRRRGIGLKLRKPSAARKKA